MSRADTRRQPTFADAREWIDATRARPCLVCGKPDWCSATSDGAELRCQRGHSLPTPPGYRRVADYRDGVPRFVLEGGGLRRVDSLQYDPRAYLVPAAAAAPAAPPARDWPELAAEFARAGAGRLHELAAELGVAVHALEALGVGWNGHAWTIPMRDATGAVTGIATRSTTWKRMIRGARAALFYSPALWSQGTGPVLIVEGMSDTAALMGIGLAAIGRPGVNGGLKYLVPLLEGWPADRGIVVVGERDQKPDGKWPGRDGAQAMAQALAAALYRDVHWTLPPEPLKDSREFAATGADAAAILAAYAGAAELVAGGLRPPHEVATVPRGEPRELEDFRAELAAGKRTALTVPGITVDRSPTGAGKTRATLHALHHLGTHEVERLMRRKAGRVLVRRREPVKSVTVLPTHQNVAERRQEMLEAGHDPRHVGVMPELSAQNCQNLGAAQAARAAGLSHGLAVCPTCPMATGCEYRRQSDQAKRRRHLLTTAEHYRRSWPSRAMSERTVVVVDERPDELLAPTITCTPTDVAGAAEFFDAVASEAAGAALKTLDTWHGPDPEADRQVEIGATAGRLRDLAEQLVAAAREVAEPGVRIVDVEAAGTMPRGWQRFVAEMLAAGPVAAPPPDALRLVVALAGGGVGVFVSGDRTADGGIARTITVHWRTGLDGKAVHLLDGTADAAVLEKLAGAPVVDVTPAGHLPAVHPVTQRVVDVTMRTATASVRGLVVALLEELAEYPRVGLIGHQRHVRALTADEGHHALPPDLQARVTRSTWFGAGDDRASNEWHREVDVLLVVGTPRPNAASVRRRLAVQGDHEAASRPDGAWCRHTWSATTAAGEAVTLKAKGYADPLWREAHQGIVRAALRQAIGRARAGLPEGIPAVVVSDEPLGLPVDLRTIAVRPPAHQEILDAMYAAAAGIAAPAAGPEDLEPLGEVFVAKCQKGSANRIEYLSTFCATFLALTVPVVVRLTGASAGRTRENLRTLEAAGLVHRVRDRFWALGPEPGAADYLLVDVRPIGDADRSGRPPEAEARVDGTRELVELVADSTPGGVASAAAIVAEAADQAVRSTRRHLAEAAERGAIVRLDRGHYAVDLPCTLAIGPRRLAVWIRNAALNAELPDDAVVRFDVTLPDAAAGEAKGRAAGRPLTHEGTARE